MRSILPSGWRRKLAAAVMFLALLGFGANLAVLLIGGLLIALFLIRPGFFRTRA